MNRFTVTHETIALDAFRRGMDDPSCGAYVQFEGRVRNHNEGQPVLRLEYEIYEPLAVKEGERLLDEALARYGIEKAAAEHRVGLLGLEEVAVVVGVSAAHRDEAFAACRYIIDELKIRLPIWKKEHYASGEARWVNCQRCASAHDRG